MDVTWGFVRSDIVYSVSDTAYCIYLFLMLYMLQSVREKKKWWLRVHSYGVICEASATYTHTHIDIRSDAKIYVAYVLLFCSSMPLLVGWVFFYVLFSFPVYCMCVCVCVSQPRTPFIRIIL